MRNVSEKIVEKVKTNFLFSYTFLKIVPFLDNVETYGRATQASDDNMARPHGMLNK
jgi:hypothetical protein